VAKRKKSASPFGEFAMEFVLLCILGIVVALAITPLLHLDALRTLDRKVSDLLMQQLASERLDEPDALAPRFVFVDIDEQSCEEWATAAGMSCTKGWATPRDQLAAILESIAAASGDAQQRPRLLVIDVELAPVAHGSEADPIDDRLCTAIVQVARSLPVVALRPVVVRPDPTGLRVEAYPSILDAAFENSGHCVGGEGPAAVGANPNLWLASPLIQPDSEGVVRSVHAWDTIDSPENLAGRIGGVGFLGAALLEPKAGIEQLACAFPASKPGAQTCADTTLTIARRTYGVSTTSQQSRIVFLVPYTSSAVTGGSPFGYAPSTIETVAAKDFVTQNQSRQRLLGGAVVVLGGSFLASDDLYTAPLGAGMPGAIVHANAIRAFATGALVEEQKSWWLKLTLIAIAALIGASFQFLGSQAKRRLPPLVDDLGEILVSIAGIALMVLAVFSIAVTWAFDELGRTGTAIGTLTPALAVAFEGLSTVVNQIKHLAHRAITYIAERR
jgi:CHASE2 domain-containing sensor protein